MQASILSFKKSYTRFRAYDALDRMLLLSQFNSRAYKKMIVKEFMSYCK